MYNHYRGKDATHDDHDCSRMAEVLMEAEAIKSDKKVMRGVHKHLKTKQKHITSIAGLRQVAQQKVKDADGDKV